MHDGTGTDFFRAQQTYNKNVHNNRLFLIIIVSSSSSYNYYLLIETSKQSITTMLLPLLLSVTTVFYLCQDAHAFYIPGVQPHSFREGEEVPLKVNSMTSTHTQMPRGYYRLPFCEPEEGIQMVSENLGEFLTGNKIQNSPYQLNMLEEVYCRKLCQKQLGKLEHSKTKLHIQYGYHNNWIIDNLPSAALGIDAHGDEKKRYAGGFPIGFMSADTKLPYIYNHVNIHVDYHANEDGGYSVVGFAVEPLSVKHEFEGSYKWDGFSDEGKKKKLKTCPKDGHLSRDSIKLSQIVKPDETILYTYDVVWEPSDIEWTSRWDIYLNEGTNTVVANWAR